MGSDIHIRIERKTADGLWERVPYVEKPWQDEHEGSEYTRQQWVRYRSGAEQMPENFTARNYRLFGILADVRNGSGFAGSDTGDAWPTIAAERGWPTDMLPIVKPDDYEADDHEYLGDHSFTWVRLAELETFPWDDIRRDLRGFVTPAAYAKLKDQGIHPSEWSSGISGPKIVCYTEDQWEAMNRTAPKDVDAHIKASWSKTAREATNDWIGEVAPRLREISQGRDLRLIIGFDS